jgi:hypothetical protein
VVKVAPGPGGTTTVTVTPVDTAGNPFGPGHTVVVSAADAKPLGQTTDRLDGSYARRFAGSIKDPKMVRIAVDAQPQDVRNR